MHVLHVVGARPNFVKLAPVFAALAERDGIRQTLVHTGQHYDANMSDVFFRQLAIPPADVNLEVRSGSHALQTAEIMTRIEPVLLSRRPDLVLVYGDVNSTLAAALVCAKLLIPVGHVEAGLRSFDRTMPEEVNRILTDQLSTFLFTPSKDANENLAREGIPSDRVHLVGNVMIDTLVRLLPLASKPKDLHIPEKYAVVTLHRASNVDDAGWLSGMLAALEDMSQQTAVIFPVHPWTRERIEQLGRASQRHRLQLCNPMPYLEFLYLERNATVVVTDSGGIQEETTYLGIPCLTVRDNTERALTVELGTNIVVGRCLTRFRNELSKTLRGESKKGINLPFWDGRAGMRIACSICAGSSK